VFLAKLRPKLSIKRVLTNIVIGMLIAVALHIWHGSSIISRIENSAMDFMIQWTQGIISSEEQTTPFVFIDIDEKTYRNWGEPATTPKDKLTDILRFVRSGSPLLTVVDIDTSEREASNIGEALKASGLMGLLSNWSNVNQDDSSPGESTVLFVRGFRASLNSDAKYLELKDSPLGSILSANNNFHSASPLFERSLYDHTIRHWRLFERTCNDGLGNVIPSVQLVAAARIYAGNSDLSTLYNVLSQYRPDSCTTKKELPSKSIALGARQLNLVGGRINDRIIYKIPWTNDAVDPNQVDSVIHQGQAVPLVTHLSAGVITGSGSTFDPSILKNRIVVIGGSFAENRDTYLTPIGMMPGAMILINAMHSLLQYGQMERPSPWLLYGLELVLILIASVIFALTETFTAKLISGLVTLVLLLPLTFSFFKYGLWLDFALPLLGVQIHETVTRWERTLIGGHS
jgi:hypothetical protein